MASRLLLLLILSTSLAYAVTPRPALMSRTASAPARSAMAPLMAGGAAQPAGSMAPTTAVVNLAKNIVGSGVLALAAGVAAYSGAGIAVLPALGIMLALCGLSCYSFSVIGRVGADAGAGTYKETWASVFGTSTSALPAAIVTFKTLVGAVAYAIIIGDSFGSINRLAGCARNSRRAIPGLAKNFPSDPLVSLPRRLPAVLCNSNLLIGAFGVFVFLPLCLMRDLSSLAVGSILGTAGTIYTSLFMLLRLVDGSYGAGGKYHEAIEKVARPLFVARAAGEPLLNAKAFVLVSMMATVMPHRAQFLGARNSSAQF